MSESQSWGGVGGGERSAGASWNKGGKVPKREISLRAGFMGPWGEGMGTGPSGQVRQVRFNRREWKAVERGKGKTFWASWAKVQKFPFLVLIQFIKSLLVPMRYLVNAFLLLWTCKYWVQLRVKKLCVAHTLPYFYELICTPINDNYAFRPLTYFNHPTVMTDTINLHCSN